MGGTDRLDDDRPEEMGGRRSEVVEVVFDQAAHVLPERGPLPLLVPDVGALEQRHDQLLRHAEDRQWRPNVCVQLVPLNCSAGLDST